MWAVLGSESSEVGSEVGTAVGDVVRALWVVTFEITLILLTSKP